MYICIYNFFSFLGGCKYAYAFEAWLHRRSKEASPTDMSCYWKKRRLSSVGTKLKCLTVKEIISTKNKSKDTQQTADDHQLEPTDTNDFWSVFKKKSSEKKPQNHLSIFFCKRGSVEQASMHYMASIYDGDTENSQQFLTFCKENMSAKQCIKVSRETLDQSSSSVWH